MPPRRANPLGDAAVPQGRLDWAIEATLVALLLFCPLAYGATEAWSQFVALTLVAILLCLAIAKRFVDKTAPLARTWAFVPMAVFVGLITLQLIPLPASVVRWISPAAVEARATLLGADTADAWQTISLYPHATARDLCLLCAAVVVFFVVLQHYRTTDRVARLLLTLTVIGLVVGGLAAFQNFTNATTVYGLVPMQHPMSGPFMNHSHFGQFMNLSVGAALGLLLMSLRSVALERDGGPRRSGVLAKRHSQRLAALCVATILVGTATTALSMTRMGVLSGLAAGGIVSAVYVARVRQRGRGTLVVVLGLLVLAAMLVAGFEVIFERLTTVRDVAEAEGGRTRIIADILPIVRQFPVVGTGLGSFEFVFPGYDRSGYPTLATHAENEYAQTLQETGAVGGLCVVAFVILIAVAWTRVVWKANRPTQHAAFGLGYGLLAIAIHSVSDFGQHVPANAFVTATCCGLVVSLARRHKQADAPVARLPSPLIIRRAAVLYPATLLLAGVTYFGLSAAWATRAAEQQWRLATNVADDLARNDWQGTDDDYRALLVLAGEAAMLAPGDVTYAYELNLFRWRAVNRGPDSPERDALLKRIADEALAARSLCPTYGPLYIFAGRLRFGLPDDDSAVALIRTGVRLAPHDPTAAFTAALLDLDAGDLSAARVGLDRAVRLGTPKSDALDVLLDASRPDDAYAMATGDRAALAALAARLTAAETRPDLVARARAESDDLLRTAAADENADASLLVQAAEHVANSGDRAAAVVLYRRALRKNYARPDWHLRVARLLMEEGRPAEAFDAAKTALRQRPGSPEALRLTEESELAVDAARRAVTTRPATRDAAR